MMRLGGLNGGRLARHGTKWVILANPSRLDIVWTPPELLRQIGEVPTLDPTLPKPPRDDQR